MSDEGERPTTTGPRISTCKPLSERVPFSMSTDQMAESVRCPLTRPIPVRMAAKRKTYRTTTRMMRPAKRTRSIMLVLPELEIHEPDGDEITVTEDALVDVDVVDERAVGGVEVDDVPTAAVEGDLGMRLMATRLCSRVSQQVQTVPNPPRPQRESTR